jgi:hypothetical protein
MSSPAEQYLGDDASDAPLPEGSIRFIWCRICYAIIGVKSPEGISGDPRAHELWHVQKGDL